MDNRNRDQAVQYALIVCLFAGMITLASHANLDTAVETTLVIVSYLGALLACYRWMKLPKEGK